MTSGTNESSGTQVPAIKASKDSAVRAGVSASGLRILDQRIAESEAAMKYRSPPTSKELEELKFNQWEESLDQGKRPGIFRG
jgi:hypothetical protein